MSEVIHMLSLSKFLKENQYTNAELSELEGKLFFEGERAHRSRVDFYVMLALSTIIATGGVIADSPATVIGAMIIAPLMTPIVATTAALMMGNPLRAWSSAFHVIAGMMCSIAIAAAIGHLGAHILDFNSNTQITARVAPRMLDLMIALAAGTAGAFAISRKEIADSIPGVAISIALVPPLCVVGISLTAGEWSDAWGALLLFLTNLLSILLAGGVVFALLGLGAAATGKLSYVNKKRAYRIIAIGVLLVAIPLSITSVKVGRDKIAQLNMINIVNEWLHNQQTDYVIKSVFVTGSKATLEISGPQQPENMEKLSTDIRKQLNQIETIDVNFVPSTHFFYH